MTRVLVDTSVWVDHYRRPNLLLADLVNLDLVLMHPVIIGEIACGTPPDRATTLSALSNLKLVNQVSVRDVIAFVERERLYGLGVGLNDLTLLASARDTLATELWTLDKRLAALADRFGILYRPAQA